MTLNRTHTMTLNSRSNHETRAWDSAEVNFSRVLEMFSQPWGFWYSAFFALLVPWANLGVFYHTKALSQPLFYAHILPSLFSAAMLAVAHEGWICKLTCNPSLGICKLTCNHSPGIFKFADSENTQPFFYINQFVFHKRVSQSRNYRSICKFNLPGAGCAGRIRQCNLGRSWPAQKLCTRREGRGERTEHDTRRQTSSKKCRSEIVQQQTKGGHEAHPSF